MNARPETYCSWFICGFVFAMVLIAGLSYGAAEENPTPIPGAKLFAVRIYNHPRTEKESKEIASGAIIFAGRFITGENMPDSIRNSAFTYYDFWIGRFTKIDPNGCFILFDVGGKDSIAILAPYGLIGWQQIASGELTGRIYQSVDSHYDLKLRITGDRVEGEGRGDFGFGSHPVIYEYYEGEVLPVTDLTDCFRTAAEAMKSKGNPHK